MSATLTEIDLDWADFEGAGRQSRRFLRELVADTPRLREMVFAVEDDSSLLAMCERHQLFDCIVLHVAKSGWRLEIHVSTGDQPDQAHSHDFSFSSLVLHGGYEHTWYKPSSSHPGDGQGNGRTSGHEALPSAAEPGARQTDLVPFVTRFEQPGSCYSIHQGVVHTATATDDTVAIVLRGPAETTSSNGREDGFEPRPEAQMNAEDHSDLRAKLERLKVI